MNAFVCTYCSNSKQSKKSLTGHETFCKLNPNRKIQDTLSARKKAMQKIQCKWCNNEYMSGNIAKHQQSCFYNPTVVKKECPVCNNEFIGKSVTCSRACANKHFRHARVGGIRYKTDDQLANNERYRDLCFRHHEKKCVVCGEQNIVAVHHLNENHNDNSIDNLIPLCPTHHQYCHSNFKYLIINQIEDYIVGWRNKNKNVFNRSSSSATD